MNLNEIYICYHWYAKAEISYRRKGSDRRSYRTITVFVLGATEEQAKADLYKTVRTKGASYKVLEVVSLDQRRIAFAFWLNDPQARHLDSTEKHKLIQFLQSEKLKQDEADQIR